MVKWLRIAERTRILGRRWLLNVAYLTLSLIAAPILLYRRFAHGKYREGWSAKLFGNVPNFSSQVPRIWFHAVSVGEVNLLPGIVQRIRQVLPHVEVVVSATTMTGMELARKHFPSQAEIQTFYAPLDFSWSVSRALERVKPTALVLAELELWPNWISMATARGTKVVVINARLSDKSFQGYRRWSWFFRNLFRQLHLIAAQDEGTASRFVELGVPQERVQQTGSIKFDGAVTHRQTEAVLALRALVAARPELRIWIAGSTIEPEEELVLDVYRRLQIREPNVRLILVPRHAERFEGVAQLIEGAGWNCCRRSQMKLPRSGWAGHEIILVDTIGELKHWWGLAEIAYVGGSMGKRGGQNMLEPAGYGAAVCFGPDTRNFRDIAARLINTQGAVRVNNKEELANFVTRVLEDPAWGEELGLRAQQLVRSGRGATDRTVELIRLLFEELAEDVVGSPKVYSEDQR
jgi:3-deoxy-D-manno-octulosonic-acid transferase